MLPEASLYHGLTHQPI